jgi:hypothetical protein
MLPEARVQAKADPAAAADWSANWPKLFEAGAPRPWPRADERAGL